MIKFKKILFPVSLTEISPKVVPYITSLATSYDAEIHLLHVSHGFDQHIDTYITHTAKPDFKKMASHFEQELSTSAKSRLLAFRNKYFQEFPNVKTTIVTGTHHKEILHYTEAEGIEMIVMGTGRGLSTIFGSVAERVTKLSSIPVMIIKTA